MRLLKLLLVMFVCAAGPAVAGPLEDGKAAYANGDYATAASWFRKADDQGDATAPYYLGFMYEKGQGVPQDYAAAEAWYRKAAERGDTTARGKLRDPPAKAPPALRSASSSSIQMKKQGGTYIVPVLINNAITLDFTVDSGASDVSIPVDVVTTLMRTGTIRDTDFIGEQTYVLADGSRVRSKTFRIRSLKVGDRVLENVIGSVESAKGSLLLGQSFLGHFKSWSIDNSRHLLILSDDSPTLAPPERSTPSAAPQASASVSAADQVYNDAFKKLQESDYARAAEGFQTFVQRYPQHALAGNAQYWLGETYYARRDYQNALAAFAEGHKTYKASPKGPDNLLKLGITLAILGRKPAACAIFVRFAQDYPRATDLQKQRIEQERQKNYCG